MAELTILFGRPERGPSADDRFELEALAADELAIESFAIPLDAVVEGDAERALRRLPRPSGRSWLYRGWMLNEEEYTALYEAIADRDEELIVDPVTCIERCSVEQNARFRDFARVLVPVGLETIEIAEVEPE